MPDDLGKELAQSFKETKAKEKAKKDHLTTYILIANLVPPLMVAIVMYIFQLDIPPWLEGAALVLIVCIESTIASSTVTLMRVVRAGVDIYSQLLKIGKEVEEPLRKLSDALLRFKDILPDVVKLLEKVNKDQLKAWIKEAMVTLEARQAVISPQELQETAERLSKTVVNSGDGTHGPE